MKRMVKRTQNIDHGF